MPRGDAYARTMADLIAQAGAAQAQGVAQRGQIWGQAMSDLGQVAPRIQQMRYARNQQARQDAMATAQMRNLERDNTRADAAEARAIRKDLTDTETAEVNNAHKLMLDIATVYGTVQDQAGLLRANAQLSSLYGINPKALLQVYDPAAVEQIAGQAMTAAERAAALVKAQEQRQSANQQGVRRMIGERVTQGPLSEPEQRQMQGMAFQEGVTIPEGVLAPKPPPQTPNPTEPSLATAAARGDPDAIAALRILKSQNASAGDVTALSPEGLDMAALSYKRTGLMPALGMGDRSTRQNIINRAAQLTAEDETRISAGIGDIAANRALYRADSGSLAAMQKQRDAITSFEKTASKNIDIFLDTAGKVVDTGSPFANSLARAVSGQALGSPNVAAYNAARQVAINEVAKITSNPNMSGVLSDTARKEVEAFNPANATLRQTVAVMRILKRDMANRTLALDETLAATRARLSGRSVQPVNGEDGVGPKVGDTKTFPNGRKGRFDGSGWELLP